MSKRMRIVVVVSLAIVAASVASRFTTSARADFIGTLNANVGPGASISLSTPEGAVVSSLGPGTYAIHVTDQATNHNFHLEGAGVNVATSIDNVETADWTVDFTDANYTYRCDRHANLTGSFVSGTPQALVAPAPVPVPAPVLTPPPPPPPPPPAVTVPPVAPVSSGSAKAAPIAYAGTLKVTLTAKDKLVVTSSGKAVGNIDTGRYKLVVSDNSRKRDVMLRKLDGGTRQLTTRSFMGTKTIGIELFGGTWKLYSGGSEKSIFSLFKVSD